jgi:C1A family cysteine protease
MANQYKLGYIKDTPDKRDFVLMSVAPRTLPSQASLRATGLLSPIRDQGALGSCVGNATASAFEYAMRVMAPGGGPAVSALAVYWAARDLENSVQDDAGCMIRDAIKSANHRGVVTESAWPYIITKFAQTPPWPATPANALVKYRRVAPTLTSIKTAIALGFPVIFGIKVYESIFDKDTESTGFIKMPRRGEKSIGGHCMLATDYDDATQLFSGPNSWGSDWGDNGFFHIPYKYLGSKTYNGDNWIAERL